MRDWRGYGKKLMVKPKAKSIDHVTIFGSAHALEDSEVVKDTHDVCKTLAEAGYVIVNGGGPGVMRAATLGAKAGGGKVIGVTFRAERRMHYEGRDPKNLFDVEIKTKNYVERTLALLGEGQVYVIFKGGTGTISEFGMAWGIARLYFGHHKPLILYGDFWQNIIKAFEDNMMLTKEEQEVYKIVSSPKQVLEAIVAFEEELAKGEHKHLKITKGELSI